MFDKLPISSKTEKILTKSLDEPISAEDANYLINIKDKVEVVIWNILDEQLRLRTSLKKVLFSFSDRG